MAACLQNEALRLVLEVRRSIGVKLKREMVVVVGVAECRPVVLPSVVTKPAVSG